MEYWLTYPRAKCWKNMRKISIRHYVRGYQSAVASCKKEIIPEYYNKSISQLTCFPPSVWKSSFYICFFGLVLIWKGSCIILWLISQLHGFTRQFQLASTQGVRARWRSYLGIWSGRGEHRDPAEGSGIREITNEPVMQKTLSEPCLLNTSIL